MLLQAQIIKTPSKMTLNKLIWNINKYIVKKSWREEDRVGRKILFILT